LIKTFSNKLIEEVAVTRLIVPPLLEDEILKKSDCEMK
jgi:hypothetical protein